MSATDTIERLVSFGPRWPGAAGDRQTTDYLVERLEELGRVASAERISVRPSYHVTHALHAAIAVAGSVISVHTPLLGVVILLLAALSTYGDLTARFYLLRNLTFPRSTANVFSPGERKGARARVVLVAHHDAARTGLLFNRHHTHPAGRLARLAGPLDLLFWMISAALLMAAARLLGVDSGVVTAIQYAIAVLLIAAVWLLIDVGLSDVAPGASDNASGVATVLEVAQRLEEQPPASLDVWIVFPAAKEGLMLGMRSWLRRRGSQLPRRSTYFINVDTVGAGDVRYVTAEGFLTLYEHDRRLIELCEQTDTAKPYAWRLGTDGVIPLTSGYPSITICCADENDRIPNFHKKSDVPDRIDPHAVEHAIDFVESLVREIDAELGERSAD